MFKFNRGMKRFISAGMAMTTAVAGMSIVAFATADSDNGDIATVKDVLENARLGIEFDVDTVTLSSLKTLIENEVKTLRVATSNIQTDSVLTDGVKLENTGVTISVVYSQSDFDSDKNGTTPFQNAESNITFKLNKSPDGTEVSSVSATSIFDLTNVYSYKQKAVDGIATELSNKSGTLSFDTDRVKTLDNLKTKLEELAAEAIEPATVDKVEVTSGLTLPVGSTVDFKLTKDGKEATVSSFAFTAVSGLEEAAIHLSNLSRLEVDSELVKDKATLETQLKNAAQLVLNDFGVDGVSVDKVELNGGFDYKAQSEAEFAGTSAVFTLKRTGVDGTKTATVGSGKIKANVIAKVTISGDAKVGATLSVTDNFGKAFTDYATAKYEKVTYTWKSGNSSVGKNESTYTLTDSDKGKIVSVTVRVLRNGTHLADFEASTKEVTGDSSSSSNTSGGSSRASHAIALDSSGNPETDAPAVTTEPAPVAAVTEPADTNPSSPSGTGGGRTNNDDGEDLDDGFGGIDEGLDGNGNNIGSANGAGNGGANANSTNNSGNPRTGMAAGVAAGLALTMGSLAVAAITKKRK